MPDQYGYPTEAELRGQMNPAFLGYAPPPATQADLDARNAGNALNAVTLANGRVLSGQEFRSSTDPEVVALRNQSAAAGTLAPNLLFGDPSGRSQTADERAYRNAYRENYQSTRGSNLLGDIASFEAFNLEDMLGKVGDDPWRAVVGAADPLSTNLWSSVTGKDLEPIVDQMGGAYGGHTISAFGNDDGGVYGRARDAGIDTSAGAGVHDLAHVLAAFYGGQGLLNIGPGPGPAAAAPATGSGSGFLGSAAAPAAEAGASAALPEIVVTGTLPSGITASEALISGAGLAGTAALNAPGAAAPGGFNGYGEMGGMQPNSGLGVFENGGAGGMADVGAGNAGTLANSGAITGGAGTGVPEWLSRTQSLLGNDLVQGLLGGVLGGDEQGGAVALPPLGGFMGSPAPAPQVSRQPQPLDQTRTRFQGYGRRPMTFNGATVWL